MRLPIEISPNPIVTSTVELRFVSTIAEGNMLPKMLSVFHSDFPTIKNSEIPKDLKESQIIFKYAPDYMLSNDDFSIRFANNVIAFETESQYPLWGVYFPFLQEQITRFFSLGIAAKLERVGLRYGSIFESTLEVNEILKYIPSVSIKGYDEKLLQYRSELKKGDFNFYLQIAEQARIEKKDHVSKSGLLIDIDVSQTQNIPIDNKIFDIIDNLHSNQKQLFFELLQDDFILSLNPKY